MNETNEPSGRPNYKWPRYVLAGVILAVLLAIIWMSFAVWRTRQYRDPTFPAEPRPATAPAGTNHSSTLQPAIDRMAEFRGLLSGGNAEAGRIVFFEKPEASCAKCHRIGGQGGDSGPVLDGGEKRQSREQILEAILFPNLHTTSNFESVILLLKNGSGCFGTLKSEDAQAVVLNTPEDGLVTIQKSDVQVRQRGLSPMPEGLAQILPPEDLRNLVEFIASRTN